MHYTIAKNILPSSFFGLPNTLTVISLDEYMAKSYLLYRPSSIFIEPAHFAAYIIPALYLLINSKQNYINKKYFYSIVLTLSLIISGSSTAIIMLIICWIKPIFRVLKRFSLKTIVFLSSLVGVLIWVFSLDYTQRAISRLFGFSLFSTGGAFYGRFGNYFRLLQDFTMLDNILGLGFGYKYNYYLPSYGTSILYMGYFGLGVFFLIMFYTYVKSSKMGKELIILSLIMFTGTNGLFGITSVLYFTLIYSEIGMKKPNKKSIYLGGD